MKVKFQKCDKNACWTPVNTNNEWNPDLKFWSESKIFVPCLPTNRNAEAYGKSFNCAIVVFYGVIPRQLLSEKKDQYLVYFFL